MPSCSVLHRSSLRRSFDRQCVWPATCGIPARASSTGARAIRVMLGTVLACRAEATVCPFGVRADPGWPAAAAFIRALLARLRVPGPVWCFADPRVGLP